MRVIVNDVVKFRKKEPIMYPVDSKLLNLSKRKGDVFGLTLDVFPAVSRWLVSQQKMNRGLIVQIFTVSDGKELDWTWDPTNYEER